MQYALAVSKPIALSIKGSTTIKFIPAKIKPDIAPEKREIKIKVIDFIKNLLQSLIKIYSIQNY